MVMEVFTHIVDINRGKDWVMGIITTGPAIRIQVSGVMGGGLKMKGI